MSGANLYFHMRLSQIIQFNPKTSVQALLSQENVHNPPLMLILPEYQIRDSPSDCQDVPTLCQSARVVPVWSQLADEMHFIP